MLVDRQRAKTRRRLELDSRGAKAERCGQDFPHEPLSLLKSELQLLDVLCLSEVPILAIALEAPPSSVAETLGMGASDHSLERCNVGALRPIPVL
jgi:hypothetical protein